MEEDGIESNFPANFRTRETADLFLILVMSLLKDGGRAGIVLPDGFLFGEGVKTRIKEKLLEECNLHTIVRLPNGVFAPYTDINTNLLFFAKGETTKEIWYFEHPLPEGYKKYNKTKPIRIEEFDLEKAWWGNRVENECTWSVTIDEIKQRNYNLDIKNPNAIGEDPFLHPLEIIDRIISNETLIKDITLKIRELMKS
jgi:type I restriction enzyme M protein